MVITSPSSVVFDERLIGFIEQNFSYELTLYSQLLTDDSCVFFISVVST